MNPTLSEHERGLVQDELTYSPEDHTLHHRGLCLQLNKFIIMTHGRSERDKSLTKLSDATKELALDFRRVHDDNKTSFIWTVHAWCIRATKYFLLHHFDGQEALFLLRKAMPDAADPLFQQALDNQTMLGDFLTSISNHYLNARVLRQILLQATTIKQHRGQPSPEFITFCRKRMSAAIGKESAASLVRLVFEGIEQNYLKNHHAVLENLRTTFLFIDTLEPDLNDDQRRTCTFAGLMRLIMNACYNTRLGAGSTHRKDGNGDSKPDRKGGGKDRNKSDKGGKHGSNGKRDSKKAHSNNNSDSALTEKRKCFACRRTNHMIADCRDKAALERYNNERSDKQGGSRDSGKSCKSDGNDNSCGDKSTRVAKNVEAALKKHLDVAQNFCSRHCIATTTIAAPAPTAVQTMAMVLVPSHSHVVMQVNSNHTQCGTCQGANDTFASIFSYSVSLPGGKQVNLASQPIGPGGMRLHAPELSNMAYWSISMEQDFWFRPVQSLMSIEQLATETDRPQNQVFEDDRKVSRPRQLTEELLRSSAACSRCLLHSMVVTNGCLL